MKHSTGYRAQHASLIILSGFASWAAYSLADELPEGLNATLATIGTGFALLALGLTIQFVTEILKP